VLRCGGGVSIDGDSVNVEDAVGDGMGGGSADNNADTGDIKSINGGIEEEGEGIDQTQTQKQTITTYEHTMTT